MANKFQELLALLGKNKQVQGQTLVPMGEFPSIRGQSQMPIDENPLYLSMRGQAPIHVSMRGKQPTHVSMRGMKPPAEMDKNLLPPALMPIGEYPSMRGGKAPVPEMQDPRLDRLNKVLPNLPFLNTNATARNAGVQTLQQAQWQQQHPLLAGIKQGAKKAKHYLLDPVYNTPTGDATIDATDPRKLTDSRLGRFAVNAITGLAQQYQNPDNPLAGAFGAYSAGAKMRENDLKEYQGRLGKKAIFDEYANWGYKPNPMLSEKQQAEGFKLFVENERNRLGNELLAEPNTTARIRKEMTPPQQVKVDPVTGEKTYTGKLTNPYAIIADPKVYGGKIQRRKQQQHQQMLEKQAQERITNTEKNRDEKGRFKAMTVAEKARHDKAMEANAYYKAHKPSASKGSGKKASGGKTSTGKTEKPATELSLLAEKSKQQKLVKTSSLTRAEKETYLAQINKAYKDGIAKLSPKKATPKATPKQEEAKKALLSAPNPKIKSKEGKAFIELLGGAGL